MIRNANQLVNSTNDHLVRCERWKEKQENERVEAGASIMQRNILLQLVAIDAKAGVTKKPVSCALLHTSIRCSSVF